MAKDAQRTAELAVMVPGTATTPAQTLLAVILENPASYEALRKVCLMFESDGGNVVLWIPKNKFVHNSSAMTFW